MKKINLKNEHTEVSAKFKNEVLLDEVLYIVEGLIHSLGYCAKGHLEFVEDEE